MTFEPDSIESLILIMIAGIISGIINVLAASGSMLILPLLIFLGIDPNVANGTNRIAILFQNIVAVRNYRKQKILPIRVNLPILIAATLGATLGSLFVVSIDRATLTLIIGYLFIVMFVVMLFKKKYWFKNSTETNFEKIKSKTMIVIFFFIGFFGGFIQAGVGVFLLAGLIAGIGYDIIRANALKVFVVLVYTPVSIAIFLYNDMIIWEIGIALALGHIIGAYFASKYASRMGLKFLNYLLLVIILLSGLEFIGVREFLLKLI